MEILDRYLDLQKEIYTYFNYAERWRVLPLDDCRSYFWRLSDISVLFSEEIEDLDGDGGYENEFFGAIYRGPEYTAIEVDTRTDGNKFLQIFTNLNERPLK